MQKGMRLILAGLVAATILAVTGPTSALAAVNSSVVSRPATMSTT